MTELAGKAAYSASSDADAAPREACLPATVNGRWNRCVEVIPSGQDAPRTWRCWFPLPCPHHGSGS